MTDTAHTPDHSDLPEVDTSGTTMTVTKDEVTEAMTIHAAFLTLMQGKGQVVPDEEVLEDAVAFAGVARFPARVKCALLAWMAWKDATLTAAEKETDQ